MTIGSGYRTSFHSDVKKLTPECSAVKMFFLRATQHGPILFFDVRGIIFARENDTYAAIVRTQLTTCTSHIRHAPVGPSVWQNSAG
jgi:hypothetical protein